MKILIKKNHLKNQRKIDVDKFNELINKEVINIKVELFWKQFSFQNPGKMVKAVYSSNYKKKNNDLINAIKSELSDLEGEIEKDVWRSNWNWKAR